MTRAASTLDGIPSSDTPFLAENLTDAEPDEFIEMCAVGARGQETYRGLYVIGSFDTSVTIYRQQVRALNLVFALGRDAGLEGKRVAIVGGGVAGTTAAVAARLSGAFVTIFERSEIWMPVQARATHRYVHPFLYEWPGAHSAVAETSDLPFLRWMADDASRVVAGLRGEFEGWVAKLGINAHVLARVCSLDPEGEQWRVSVDHPAKAPQDAFDVVLLALGFGVERRESGTCRHDDTAPYWFPDALERALHECRDPGPLRVVGGGDGGLIDAIRCAVRLPHRELFRRVMSSQACVALAERMRDVDDKRRVEAKKAKPAVEPGDPYASLQNEVERACTELELERACRSQAVRFITRGENPYPLNTALVNRLLVRCLWSIGRLIWRPGDFVDATRAESDRIDVETQPPLRPPDTEGTLVLVRIGPDPTALDDALPQIVRRAFLETTKGLEEPRLQDLRGRHVRLTVESRAFFEAQVAAVAGTATADLEASQDTSAILEAVLPAPAGDSAASAAVVDD